MTLIPKSRLFLPSVILLCLLGAGICLGSQNCDPGQINDSLPAFKLNTLKPGMSLDTVERKIKQKLVLKKTYPLESKNYKTSFIIARNCIYLRFQKNILFGISVVYPIKQWANLNELITALSKDLNIKTPWKFIDIFGNYEMRAKFFRKYQIIVDKNNDLYYSVSIHNAKIAELFRKQVERLKAKTNNE
jgi:hypothetical protein